MAYVAHVTGQGSLGVLTDFSIDIQPEPRARTSAFDLNPNGQQNDTTARLLNRHDTYEQHTQLFGYSDLKYYDR